MPTLAEHQSSTITKMLLVGNSGAGKTGALASLAAAGYNLRIIDLDNGLDILANLLKDPAGRYGKDALARVDYETVVDKMSTVGGRLMPTKADAWQKLVDLLEKWHGGVHTWGEKDVLVIDSLTFAGKAALNFVLKMNARLGQQPHQSDWFQAQGLIETMCQKLYDDGVRCNVVMNCHVKFIGKDGVERGYPDAPGKALSPIIGRYFNSILMAESTGSGQNVKRQIFTQTRGVIELKNTAPGRVKAEYPLETGLADYFRDVRGVK